jgi:flavin reductase (DIM6/NTAB) family NADH-FMN oxidoreductase RutF
MSVVDCAFDGVAWESSPLGDPVLGGIVAWVDCVLEKVVELGDWRRRTPGSS